jgi:dTDP-4-amino-4,6-dideoxygalactose transaminase
MHHIFNQFVIRIERRNTLQKFLKDKEVGTEIYYPVPFHRQECFANLGARDEDFPVSNCAATESLALPIYPELTPEQIEFVVGCVAEFQKSAYNYPVECKHGK